MEQQENVPQGAENLKKRTRFDVRVLERYEFVDFIVEYLKNSINATIDPPTYSNHLAFYKGFIRERNKQIPLVIVGYGGSGTDLRDLPTPLQTELLPLVFDHWNKVSGGNSEVPLMILGHSFDECFLRKIRLLETAIADVRLIQFVNVDRFRTLEQRFSRIDGHYKSHLEAGETIKNEVEDFQAVIVAYLKSGGELGGRTYEVLDFEVPAGEGTKKSEMIDIIVLERKRRWLTVIELKYEKLLNTRLQSVIFQGLDYCNWVEDHKRGLAMLFPKYAIDVRRRTRLVLINGPDGFPEFHKEFAKACGKRDRYQEIELYSTNNRVPLSPKQLIKISNRA